MKRKFIFLVMLFALLGGVNFSANAQEQIEIGEGSTSSSYSIPSYTYYGNRSFTQQIYTQSIEKLNKILLRKNELGHSKKQHYALSYQL